MSAFFAGAALIFGVVRLGLFVALHLVPNEYSIVKHAVSDYAVGSTRKLSTVMTWVTVLFWASLAAAVWTGLPDWSDVTGITLALAALAVIFLVLPYVPTDIEGEEPTLLGRLHYVLAIAWFAISYSCQGNFVRYYSDHGPAALGTALQVLSWITLVSLVVSVAVLVLKKLRPYVFGISERVFLVAVSLFYIGVAVELLIAA